MRQTVRCVLHFTPYCVSPNTIILCNYFQSQMEQRVGKGKRGTKLLLSCSLLSRVRLSATPWTAPRQASLSITNSWSLLKLLSTELVMPSNRFILCHPLLLLPSILPNWEAKNQRVAQEAVTNGRWRKTGPES